MAINTPKNESIEWGNMVSHSNDTGSLCESQHNIGVGISKQDGKIIPLQDYIVVGFQAFDSSGGGYVSDVIGGGLMLFIDPVNYVNTVGEGLATHSRNEGVVYGEGFWGGVAQYSNEAIFNIGGNISTIWNESSISPKNWWAESHNNPYYSPLAKQFRSETDWVGTDLHQSTAPAHKIRIQIYNTYNNKTIMAYDSELAGCIPLSYSGDCDVCCTGTSYARFIINRPGSWTVKITPIGSGTCANPVYEETWTWEVITPEDWQESAISTASTDVSKALQDAGIPLYISPIALVGGMSLIGGMIIYKIINKRKS
jgi:hypothetical protein